MGCIGIVCQSRYKVVVRPWKALSYNSRQVTSPAGLGAVRAESPRAGAVGSPDLGQGPALRDDLGFSVCFVSNC